MKDTPNKAPDEEEDLRAEIVRVAIAILDCTLGITEGSRRLAALGSHLGADRDSDFIVFVGIDSETDRFPLGAVRSHWSSDALARYDTERQTTEEHYRQRAEEACRSLIRRYAEAD